MANGQSLAAQGSQREQGGVNPERWRKIETVFEQALAMGEGERARFVQSTCAGDEELQREVEAMLQSHETVGRYLDHTDDFFTAGDLSQFRQGERIDRYRILREIGRGGIGVVFLAERADEEYEQLVALKVIKRGMDTASVLRHFRAERQILARLDHPNIARLIDGGTTESGLPYFVMEYVAGLPIDEYCRAHALPIVERLKLFREVCAAVSQAHSQLIVHRDIKRSNILVTEKGVPKLLDFGIASILREGDAPEPLLTATGMRLMTPEYASPEQVRGEPVTAVSDVYSLGVVLYELLCGQPPYRLPNQSPYEMARVVTESEPKKPSAIVTQTNDSQPAMPRRKQLRGDLDNIVLMALRKEPSRRYQSVEQFSADIRRHLEDRPVLAGKDTVGYRAGKFIRRNKIALAAAALIIASLLAGVVATSRQARIAHEQSLRAERRFNDVRKLANSVLFDYHDAIKALPGATKVRERLVKDALVYLDSLAADAHGDPALQRELAAAYERVGDVRGGETSGSLGDQAGATESYQKALAIREALAVQKPNDPQARHDLASSHQKIGFRLANTRESGKGAEHLRKALALYLGLAREEPSNNDLQLELASTHNQLAWAIDEESPEGVDENRAALAICEKLVAGSPRDPRYRSALCSALTRMAQSLFLRTDVAGAIEANNRALALEEALLVEDPLNAAYRRRLVVGYQHAGDYLKQTDKAAALEYFQKAAAQDEELLATDPGNALTGKDLAYTHKRIADFLVEQGDYAQALPHFRKAVEGYEKVVADAPSDLVSQFLVVTCGAGAARMHARLGEIDAAIEKCGKAQAQLRQIKGGEKGNLGRAQANEYLGQAYQDAAASSKVSTEDARRHATAARDMFQQALSILDDSRRQGALGANEQWAKEISAEIAESDAVLKR